MADALLLTLSRTSEQAAIAYIKTLGLMLPDGATAFTNIFCGKASVSKDGPTIIAYAERAKFDANYSGLGTVSLHIIIKYPLAVDADNVDPVLASDALTAKVFGAFKLGEAGNNHALADALNALNPPIANFTALKNTVISEDANATEGQVWEETLTVEIYAAQVSGY